MNLFNLKIRKLTTEQKKKIKKYILISIAVIYVLITLPILIVAILLLTTPIPTQ